jgi:hypothetical protein
VLRARSPLRETKRVRFRRIAVWRARLSADSAWRPPIALSAPPGEPIDEQEGCSRRNHSTTKRNRTSDVMLPKQAGGAAFTICCSFEARTSAAGSCVVAEGWITRARRQACSTVLLAKGPEASVHLPASLGDASAPSERTIPGMKSQSVLPLRLRIDSAGRRMRQFGAQRWSAGTCSA